MFRPEGVCQLFTSDSKQLTETLGSKRPALDWLIVVHCSSVNFATSIDATMILYSIIHLSGCTLAGDSYHFNIGSTYFASIYHCWQLRHIHAFMAVCLLTHFFRSKASLIPIIIALHFLSSLKNFLLHVPIAAHHHSPVTSLHSPLHSSSLGIYSMLLMCTIPWLPMAIPYII